MKTHTRSWIWIALVTPVLFGCGSQLVRSEESASVPAALESRIALKPNTSRAKNVIVFIGDGMGISTITAGRIFDGQRQGMSGEEHALAFESFPYTGLVKVYNTNQQVPDSAGTATAIFTGAKTRAGVIGIGPIPERGDCDGVAQHSLESLLDMAETRGMATGIVTTTRLTHATPAALYAHIPDRDWESDEDFPPGDSTSGCVDVARQLVEYDRGDGPDVVLGGGWKAFVGPDHGGERIDRRHLPNEWRERAPGRTVARTLRELESAPETGQLLGIFSRSHLEYMVLRDERHADQPTLTQMTLTALDRLNQSDAGYLLMVEGGRIDHGHHDGYAGRALAEMAEFNRAIAATMDRIDTDETLVMVTADHSHGFTMAGYATRGNPILGYVHGNDDRGNPQFEPAIAQDGHPYTTLGYAHGEGAIYGSRGRPETGVLAMQQAIVPTEFTDHKGVKYLSETHGGEDVAVFAQGPWAHLASGVLEQNLLFDIVTYALGW